MGDLHGDLEATRAALRLADAIDGSDRWIGGTLVVVQTGDQLDRGPDDREVLDLFDRLAGEAWDAGGAVYALTGNHETMNVELDLGYVHDDAFAAFDDIPYDPEDPVIAAFGEAERGRAAAFRPGGPYAMMLAGRNVVMQVGRTAFVHGGLTPDHVAMGLEAINLETQAWMRGGSDEPAWLADSGGSPQWVRDYSDEPGEEECATLATVLDALDADQMVVGHTVQDTINAACDGRVWRIDVGMSAYYGGSPAVLELADGIFSVLE